MNSANHDEQHSIKHDSSQPPTQNHVSRTVLARHSTRIFLRERPVPLSTIEECLSLAQHSPSATNVQPWRVAIAYGAARDRLSTALIDAVNSGADRMARPIPDEYKHYRSDLGHQLYGPEGYNIPRTDKDGTKKAQMRNYAFFDAPMVAIVSVDKNLNDIDILSTGMYLQTFVLLLTERGLGTCAEVSLAEFPQVLRKELNIDENQNILTGLAIGYEDETQHVNSLNMEREAWKSCVKFVE